MSRAEQSSDNFMTIQTEKNPKRKLLGFRTRQGYFPDAVWSGLRGSNSLPPPWQGGALPDELNPHGRICASGKPMRSCHCCGKTLTYSWCLRAESNQRHGDFQSPALPTELQRQIRMATWMRLELTTSAVTGRRSNQLNYQAKRLVGTIGLEPMTLCL